MINSNTNNLKVNSKAGSCVIITNGRIFKRRNIFWFFHLFFLFVSMSACNKFVEIEQPDSQLTKDVVFENSITATAAMTDIYAQMRENGIITGRADGLSSLLGNYADEFQSYESGIYTTATFYSNSLLPTISYVANIWNNSYRQLYATNAMIAGVKNSTSLKENDRNQLKGEALFIRAFLHLYLVNIFGDIPYITTTDYRQNRSVTRNAVGIVYQNIIADLDSSIELLNSSYVHADRTRPNKSTAQALLARVYLYNGDYEASADMASAIINNATLYTWESDLDKVFLRQSRSTIWQLSAGANGANTWEGISFIFLAGPPNKFSLTDELVNQFENNDLRKVHWVKEVTNGSQVWYHPFKYKENNTTVTTRENSIVFRLAEQYLIRAEARIRQGDLMGAKEDLNIVRQRAGLPVISALSQNEILQAVLKERCAELFTEFGHRFFDLKRFDKLDETLQHKPGWNSTDALWPLPQSEMNANPFLSPQNPGY